MTYLRTVQNVALAFQVLVHMLSAGVLISVENRIETFSEAGNSSLVVTGAKHIIGLSNPVYTNNEFSSIFATELGTRGPSVYQISKDAQVLLADPAALAATPELPSYFEAIAFDQQTNQLFLTSKNAKTIYKMSANKGGQPTPFISTEYKKPTGISIDPCSRNVFWTNSDRKLPSIEAFHLDTGNSWTMINTNLTRPKAITVDAPERKLYWTDNRRGEFWISRVNLDGTKREVVCSGKDHEAFSIVVTEEFIYWSDWTSHGLWRTRKSGECNFELIQKFTTSKPHGVSFIPDTKYKCDEYHDVTKKPIIADSITTTTEVPPVENQNHVKPETENACTNYCFNGECTVLKGEPICDCTQGFVGSRCEIDQCFNFCMENGKCLVIEDEPECLCLDGYKGERCEIVQLPIINENPERFVNASPTSLTIGGNLNILVYILGGATGVLTIVTIVLSVLVTKLRMRSRVVRKRFMSVAKPKNKEHAIIKDGLQFDIETCCNQKLRSCGGAQDKKLLLVDDCEEL